MNEEKITGTEKEFLDVFRQLCISRSSWQVWADLMAAMACTLANAVDKSLSRHTAREKEYAECIKRLGGVEKPAKCFAIVVEALERNPDQDFLGRLYMSLELGNHWKGQFFTPYDVCRCMAELTIHDNMQKLQNKEWVSVNDPACGAGATLIAAANTFRRKGFNYQTQVLFVANDIDRVTAQMCFIQLSLLGCPGYVAVDSIPTDGTADMKLIVPKTVAKKLVSMGIIDDVAVTYTRNRAVFKSKEYTIYTRLIEGKYFDYNRFFMAGKMKTYVSRPELVAAMTRAKMCTEEKKPAVFEMNEDQLNIRIADRLTDYQEEVKLQDPLPEPLKIGFDSKLVLETLKAFTCENIAMNFSGPKMPAVVEAEDSDMKAIVLPVMIREE